MKIYQIEIIEPKAKKLIQELVNLNLIKIKEINDSKKLITKLPSKDDIEFNEITKEDELVSERKIFGKLKGFVKNISNDFDESLDDFKYYM